MFWANILETIMLLCFAAAWPASIYKSWKCRTRKGKSIVFLIIILIGYITGILKVIVSNSNYVMLIPYSINTLLVATDTYLYYRNYRIDEGLKPIFPY